MMKVYLDSQDFSHFSSKHKDHQEYASLKHELLQLKKEGGIQYVFSDVHIYEVYPKNGAATAEGLERIKTIAEFCGTDSLPAFTTLLAHEVESELCRRRGETPRPLSNNWFPDVGLRKTPMERPPKNNRAERRGMARIMRRKNDGKSAIDDLQDKYPFLDDSSIFLKYYAYQAEWDDVVCMIEASIQDIESFSSWIISDDHNGFNIPAILRSGYDSYVDAVNVIRNEVERLAKYAGTQAKKAKISSAVSTQLEKSLVELRSTVIPSLMGDLDMYNPNRDAVMVTEKTPCFDALLRYLAELVRRSSQIANPRKPVGSDLADALHVAYFPKVNLFRTDAAAANALAQLYPDRKSDIVANVFQLPIRIKAVA